MPPILAPHNDSDELLAFYSQVLQDNEIALEIQDIAITTGVVTSTSRSWTECVQLKFTNQEIKPLHLFVKRLELVDGRNEKVKKAFAKEAFFYKKFLPEALSFCEKRDEYDDIQFKDIFPKCYFASNDVIILDHVATRGDVLKQPEDLHSFLQAQIVMESLGKIHGVFYTMIQEMGIEDFKSKFPLLLEETEFLNDEKTNDAWGKVLEISMQIVKAHPPLQETEDTIDDDDDDDKAHPPQLEANVDDSVLTFLESQNGKLLQELRNVLLTPSQPDKPLVSVNLGDVWGGNLFFVCDRKDKSYQRTVFVDMQETRLGSPMLDVTSYIFSSVQSNVQLQHWGFFLDTFLEYFEASVQSLGAEFQMKLKELKPFYTENALFGLFYGINTLIQSRIYDKLDKGNKQSGGNANNDEVDVNKWLRDNPESGQILSTDISSAIKIFRKIIAVKKD